MTENRYLTIRALTKYIKRKFDADPYLKDVYVKGEISNFKQHSSGHMYFTLKDENARILSVMFSSANRSMKFSPENGMNVLVRGDVSVFESSGQYQLYVKEMQPDGIGELFLAYEQLKAKLEKEGLFDAARKRKLPMYPKAIGVITSPTGAAVRDIITTIQRRYPIGKVLVIPALVQGQQSAASIVEAIEKANQMEGLDVLIVGRGGGSIEELWSFNEEAVARAIYQSALPVISAVGHETDFTIADFVADMRAPTPTGAAELAVPHIEEIIERVMNLQMRLARVMRQQVDARKKELDNLQRSYAFRNPMKLYEQKMEEVDRLTERLIREKNILFASFQDQLKNMESRLQRSHPSGKLDQHKEKYKHLNRWLQKYIQDIYKEKVQALNQSISTLKAMNPLNIMERGYSVAYNEKQEVIKSTAQVSEGDHIRLHLKDGRLVCSIENIEEESEHERN
ncbi:exodeoxyribonuclease VII large subunit [Falsibacillus albus]|uniref:Exodeoxyribonuclease 7 large subunit n=1 Tax=Falsibacillus albus TaxID=2478915 RepID=A0A3L7K623_9BACI|nr:exodeoxyribonuclease VII large subunit [Falsibacillus albus]RLQ98280.1 exodeoxyribonuclease VII large subunit [Falsibacillus albus]